MLLIFLPIAYALDYYADVNINVDKDGFVTIQGKTNSPGLLVDNTNIYTSKNKGYWMLNITTENQFSDFIYRLNLPPSASINYIKGSGSFRIEHKLRSFSIIGLGENKPLSIIVQYNMEKKTDFGIYLLLLSIAIIIFLFLLRITKANLSRKEKQSINLDGLSARQKKIMNLLIEKKKPLTQKYIQTELKLPKASVSRNIRTLELRNKITKEDAGMSNIIKLR